MNKTKLLKLIQSSDLTRKWHWYSYHFSSNQCDGKHPFANSMLDACIVVENAIPGFSESFAHSMASICGREKDLADYQQLLQLCSELLVIHQLVSHDWGFPCTFVHEPVARKGGKNPELRIQSEYFNLFVEVKCPSLMDHQEKRRSRLVQTPYRTTQVESHRELAADPNNLTLPRDNPVKDFLVSANDKFADFAQEPNFSSVLVINWDDHVFEPISVLCNGESGLLTKNSFYRDDSGNPIVFDNIHAVVVLRQQTQLVRAAGDQPLIDPLAHAFDYGTMQHMPFKAWIPVSGAPQLSEDIRFGFQADLRTDLAEHWGEYRPTDVVLWYPHSSGGHST